MAKLVCSCRCFSNLIIKLHAMDEKACNDFLIVKNESEFYV